MRFDVTGDHFFVKKAMIQLLHKSDASSGPAFIVLTWVARWAIEYTPCFIHDGEWCTWLLDSIECSKAFGTLQVGTTCIIACSIHVVAS